VKALVLKGKGILSVEDVAMPNLERGEVIIRMHACGVCGTDIEKVRGEAITPPVLGHEAVGEVYRVSNGVKGIKPGDRVFAHHHAPCYSCVLCKKGEYTLCEEFPRHNIRPGGFSEFYAVPRWNVERGAVLKIPDNLDYELATFVEPLGCCLRGLNKLWFEGAEKAVIYGAGPTGLIFLKLLKMKGCGAIVADTSEYRRMFASQAGAEYAFDPRVKEEKVEALDSLGGKPEVAIVATGSTAAFTDAIETVSKGGRVLIFGSPPQGSKASIELPTVFLKGLTILSSYSTSEVETNIALKMLSERKIDLQDLITHRFSLDEAVKAFDVAMDQKCIKAIVISS
jgi:L-iditol 2-dehydrogenase